MSRELVFDWTDGIDWDTHSQHLGNLHTHSYPQAPQNQLAAYQEVGVEILAFNNADFWPWSSWSDLGQRDSGIWGWDEPAEDRDPVEEGMIAIHADEPAIGTVDSHHYTGMPGDDWEQQDTLEDAFNYLDSEGMVGWLAHPGRYSTPRDHSPRYTDLYEEFDVDPLLGQEIWNRYNAYPYDERLYDEIQSRVSRPVFLFAADDDHIHSPEQINGEFDMSHLRFILPEFDPGENREYVFDALRNGHFYPINHPAGESDAPIIDSVNVDETDKTITIQATDADEIHWISNGVTVERGETCSYSDDMMLGNHLRAKLIKGPGRRPEGRACTQPWMFDESHIEAEDGDSWHMMREVREGAEDDSYGPDGALDITGEVDETADSTGFRNGDLDVSGELNEGGN